MKLTTFGMNWQVKNWSAGDVVLGSYKSESDAIEKMTAVKTAKPKAQVYVVGTKHWVIR